MQSGRRLALQPECTDHTLLGPQPGRAGVKPIGSTGTITIRIRKLECESTIDAAARQNAIKQFQDVSQGFVGLQRATPNQQQFRTCPETARGKCEGRDLRRLPTSCATGSPPSVQSGRENGDNIALEKESSLLLLRPTLRCAVQRPVVFRLQILRGDQLA